MSAADDLVTVKTDGIVVSAGSVLVDREELENNYIWGCYFCIENNSERKIRLLGKNWNITDEKGNNYNDSSAGFKGELPELEPGEVFEFTSYAPLKSENAVFYGSCKIDAGDCGKVRDIKMPTFNLSAKGGLSKRILN